MGEKYYTPEEIAEHLKLSVYTVKDKIRKGEIPGTKIGNRHRVSESAYEEYLAKRQTR